MYVRKGKGAGSSIEQNRCGERVGQGKGDGKGGLGPKQQKKEREE